MNNADTFCKVDVDKIWKLVKFVGRQFIPYGPHVRLRVILLCTYNCAVRKYLIFLRPYLLMQAEVYIAMCVGFRQCILTSISQQKCQYFSKRV